MCDTNGSVDAPLMTTVRPVLQGRGQPESPSGAQLGAIWRLWSEQVPGAAGVGKRRRQQRCSGWGGLDRERARLSSDLLLARLDESESNRIHEQFAYDLNSRALPPPRFRLELSISSTQSAPLGVAREEMIRAVYLLGIAAEACAGLRSVRTAGYDGERGCWVDDSDSRR